MKLVLFLSPELTLDTDLDYKSIIRAAGTELLPLIQFIKLTMTTGQKRFQKKKTKTVIVLLNTKSLRARELQRTHQIRLD